MQSICSSYLSTTSVSSRLWAKNAGSAACPLGPAHRLYSECAALSSASLLSLSYHLLRSLILACAGTDARLCAGGELLALLLALHFYRRMELSVHGFLATMNVLPSYTWLVQHTRRLPAVLTPILAINHYRRGFTDGLRLPSGVILSKTRSSSLPSFGIFLSFTPARIYY